MGRAAFGKLWPAPLAAAAGVSESLARSWKAGTRVPSQEAFEAVYNVLLRKIDGLLEVSRQFPLKSGVPLNPLPAEEQAGDWIAAAGPQVDAAAPTPAPSAALTERQLARIERALEARGVRVLLGPPGDPTIRARAEADRAAGRVVYVADLPQHADLIGE